MVQKLNFILPVLAASALVVSTASAVPIESFETGADGYFIVPATVSASNNANFQAGVSTTGATDGLSSLAITPTAANTGTGPNYQQLINSPTSLFNTAALKGATTFSFDVTVAAGAFNGFIQFDCDINNTDTGFVSLDGYGYPAAAIGAVTTFTLTIPTATAAILTTSTNPTAIVFQVGGGYSGSETFYLDNLRSNSVATPEPASIGVLGLGSLLLGRRRSRA